MLPLLDWLPQPFGYVGHAQRIIPKSLFVMVVVKSVQRCVMVFACIAIGNLSQHRSCLYLNRSNPIKPTCTVGFEVIKTTVKIFFGLAEVFN
jgi:hypothetical protein